MLAQLTVEGHTLSDLERGLEEALRLIKDGYLSGNDKNETGRYSFDVKGDEVAVYALAKKGDFEKMKKARFDHYDEAADAAKKGDVITGLNEARLPVVAGSTYIY